MSHRLGYINHEPQNANIGKYTWAAHMDDVPVGYGSAYLGLFETKAEAEQAIRDTFQRRLKRQQDRIEVWL